MDLNNQDVSRREVLELARDLFLASITGGALATIAGCIGQPPTPTPTPTPREKPTQTPVYVSDYSILAAEDRDYGIWAKIGNVGKTHAPVRVCLSAEVEGQPGSGVIGCEDIDIEPGIPLEVSLEYPKGVNYKNFKLKIVGDNGKNGRKEWKISPVLDFKIENFGIDTPVDPNGVYKAKMGSLVKLMLDVVGNRDDLARIGDFDLLYEYAANSESYKELCKTTHKFDENKRRKSIIDLANLPGPESFKKDEVVCRIRVSLDPYGKITRAKDKYGNPKKISESIVVRLSRQGYDT